MFILGRASIVACALALLPACGSLGQYVWFNELPKTEFAQANGEYVIGVGDTIQVQVYEQDNMTTQAKIRSDGRIALPFVGEIVAVGKHPSDLTRELQARLREFIVSPRVVVNVTQSQPVVISTLGEVGHVGTITLESQAGLLEAIAQAGGLSEYADKSAIFVLRRTPEFRRIRFTYDALLQNKDNAAAFSLRTGDVVVVE
ncbi:MAG TPA: polysaccharide biosynthesis/export family protein [Polyangiaceae bacterium]|nr:polysaccharide biosynthesis/export family protein [Polyangiaceae bacterium]